jgi:hypothetical protein
MAWLINHWLNGFIIEEEGLHNVVYSDMMEYPALFCVGNMKFRQVPCIAQNISVSSVLDVFYNN